MTMNRQFFCINQDKNIDNEAIMSASSFLTFLFYWLWLYIDGQLPKGIATSRKIEVNIILYLNILTHYGGFPSAVVISACNMLMANTAYMKRSFVKSKTMIF
jgi:hypothetical protein